MGGQTRLRLWRHMSTLRPLRRSFNPISGGLEKDNGHRSGWPSHARLSIALRTNSHSRWDPMKSGGTAFFTRSRQILVLRAAPPDTTFRLQLPGVGRQT